MPSELHPFEWARGVLAAGGSASGPSGSASGGAPRTLVKVCGLTRAADVALLGELAVDAVGFIFAARSKRALSLAAAQQLATAAPAQLTRVGVFVDASLAELKAAQSAAGLHLLQLHGVIPEGVAAWAAARGVGLIRALSFEPSAPPLLPPVAPFAALLLDGPEAGSGRAFDWQGAAALRAKRGWVLAGGLHPDNVAEALHALRPGAVDVASGVESAPGVKSSSALRAFMQAVRAFDAASSDATPPA